MCILQLKIHFFFMLWLFLSFMRKASKEKAKITNNGKIIL